MLKYWRQQKTLPVLAYIPAPRASVACEVCYIGCIVSLFLHAQTHIYVTYGLSCVDLVDSWEMLVLSVTSIQCSSDYLSQGNMVAMSAGC